jgi:hypothetical protein
LATLGAAGFFGGSTTACGVAAGVAATRAGATVTVYDDGGACARSTTGSARFGVGATAAGLDKRGTANAAPTITTTPASMSLARRVSRWGGANGRGAEDFAGDVTCSAAGGVFSMAKYLSAGGGSRRLQGSGTTSATPGRADQRGCFAALVAPGRPDDRNSHAGWLFTGVRAIAGERVTERSLDFQHATDNPIRPMSATAPPAQSTISAT